MNDCSPPEALILLPLLSSGGTATTAGAPVYMCNHHMRPYTEEAALLFCVAVAHRQKPCALPPLLASGVPAVAAVA